MIPLSFGRELQYQNWKRQIFRHSLCIEINVRFRNTWNPLKLMWFSYEWLNISIPCQMPKPIVLTLPSPNPPAQPPKPTKFSSEPRHPLPRLSVRHGQGTAQNPQVSFRRGLGEYIRRVHGSACLLPAGVDLLKVGELCWANEGTANYPPLKHQLGELRMESLTCPEPAFTTDALWSRWDL